MSCDTDISRYFFLSFLEQVQVADFLAFAMDLLSFLGMARSSYPAGCVRMRGRVDARV